jgi:hypothetical protein
MTRRTILRGLLDLPFDPLLVPLVVAEVYAQWNPVLRGDRITRLDGVTTHVDRAGEWVQAQERLTLGILVALGVWLLPALVRRSRRRAHGQPTRRDGAGLFDGPWHRDPIFWIAVVFYAATLLDLPDLASFRDSMSGPRVPTTEHLAVDGGWIGRAARLLLALVGTFLSAALLVVFRGIYRNLGRPRRPRVPRPPVTGARGDMAPRSET